MAPRWTGQVILGTGFWVLCCLVVFALIAWGMGWFKGSKLTNMLSSAFQGERVKSIEM